MTRLTTDVTNLQNAYMMIIRLGVRAPIMVIVAWIFSFRISPSISLVFLACIPILAIGLCGLAVLVHPVFERVFHTYDALNNVVDENLQGIRVVKSYNRESFEVGKFGRISQRIFKDFTKAERIMSFNSPLMMVCVYASMILIAWMGAQQIVASGNNAAVGLTTGDLTALVTYAMQILMAMMMLSMIFIMVIISQASAERICQVLQEESTVTDPASPVTDMADGSIEFDHVTFRYSDSSEKPVLDDINLKIRSGMTIGIVGGTGSAKSSLVQLVPRLYDVSSGSLKVGGVDVRDYDLEACATRWPWYCRRTCCSPAPSPRISGGATRTPPTRRSATPRSLRRLTDSCRNSPTSTTPTSSREHQRLRRPAPAPVHRPRAAEEAEDPHPRRFDQRRRHQD